MIQHPKHGDRLVVFSPDRDMLYAANVYNHSMIDSKGAATTQLCVDTGHFSLPLSDFLKEGYKLQVTYSPSDAHS